MSSTPESLLAVIESGFRDTSDRTGRTAMSPEVRAAMAAVPRDAFVPLLARLFAWDDDPLPIGHGQMISQPFVVALMTEVLDLAPTDRVLEIGTGCGYQTAVLARLAAEVCSIECIPELAAESARRLADLANVKLRVGDGRQGWTERAPFDAILVAAASTDVPMDLVSQLAPGGRMILPVELPGGEQSLRLVRRTASGEIAEKEILPVRFVPLIRLRESDPP